MVVHPLEAPVFNEAALDEEAWVDPTSQGEDHLVKDLEGFMAEGGKVDLWVVPQLQHVIDMVGSTWVNARMLDRVHAIIVVNMATSSEIVQQKEVWKDLRWPFKVVLERMHL